MASSDPWSRNPPPPEALARIGVQQGDLSEQRYHQLLAAARQQYAISPRPNAGSGLHTVTFDEYKGTEVTLPPVEAALEELRGEKRYIEAVGRNFDSNPKTVEGGILYTLAEPQFWSIIDYYHSKGTTGKAEWDTLLTKLKSNPSRGDVPCMFVSTPFGCHTSACPFHHPSAESITAARDLLLSKRRLHLLTPTSEIRQRWMHNTFYRADVLSDTPLSDSEMGKLMSRAGELQAVCANPLCAKELGEAVGRPVLKCSKCQWATYDTAECQKACWKKHKKVCIPVEELIAQDKYWTMEGWLVGEDRSQPEDVGKWPTGNVVP